MHHTFLSKTFVNLLNMWKLRKKCLAKEWQHIIVVDKSADHIKPHLDSFFSTISMSEKMFLFFRAQAEKALHDMLTRAVISFVPQYQRQRKYFFQSAS